MVLFILESKGSWTGLGWFVPNLKKLSPGLLEKSHLRALDGKPDNACGYRSRKSRNRKHCMKKQAEFQGSYQSHCSVSLQCDDAVFENATHSTFNALHPRVQSQYFLPSHIGARFSIKQMHGRSLLCLL